MKLNIIFGLVLVVASAQQGKSSVLKSSIKNEIVLILNTANDFIGQVAKEADDYFIQKLKNETEIQEWSVNIQAKVATGAVTLGFKAFNAYKDYIVNKNATDVEKKVLGCVSNEETSLTSSMGDAASQNGWCNNRLAANLTRAFQDTTKNLVALSDSLSDDIASLNKCWLGDDICLTEFIAKVVALAQSAVSPTGDTLLTSIQDVARVYKIMFGEDVPRCNSEYLFPLLLQGVQSSFTNIASCINS